jgi:hypothetical protein
LVTYLKADDLLFYPPIPQRLVFLLDCWATGEYTLGATHQPVLVHLDEVRASSVEKGREWRRKRGRNGEGVGKLMGYWDDLGFTCLQHAQDP